MNKFIIPILIVLCLFPLVNAQAFQENADPNALKIEYTKITTLTQDTSHEFVFHVSNSTQKLTNSSTTCSFDLFSNNGTKIYGNNDIDYVSNNEWSVTLLKGNFTELGKHSFVTQCNTDNQTGFVSSEILVSPSGDSGTDNIVFFLFVIVFIYGITFIGFFNKSEIITLLGGMAMLFLGIYLVNNGIIIFRDTLTNYIAYLTIGIGSFLSFMAAYSLYQDL